MHNFMTTDMTVSEIVLCALVTSGTPIHKNRKSHGLVFYPEARCIFNFDSGECIKAEENSIIYLPVGSNYVVTTKKPGICYAINFHILQDIRFHPFCAKVKNSATFLQYFRDADRSFRSAAAGHIMKCRSYLCGIISDMQHEYSLGYVSGDKKDIIAKATELIHERYTEENLRVSDLAHLCGISAEYFRSIFGNVYGTSPVKYITGLRISRAKELLSSGMYSVTETAHMCGFEDAGYFSREFKKYTGITPREYGI